MNHKSAIESILFFYGEPIAIVKIAKIIGAEKAEVERALEELQEECRAGGRGIAIIRKGDLAQMTTNPDNAKYMQEMITGEMREELTTASLETVAIIAYRGPVVKSEIDYIRGVNSGFILRNLLMRGIIERRENEKDARSFVYSVSFDFLKLLGIGSVRELPNFNDLAHRELI